MSLVDLNEGLVRNRFTVPGDVLHYRTSGAHLLSSLIIAAI
jgi:hypothetical protein